MSNLVMGYCRVSTRTQNEARQLEKMKELQIDDRYIFVDKMSGENFDRPKYKAMKQMIRPGDLIYLDALDRLGRNYDEIIKEWKQITRLMEADIVVLENAALFDSRKFKQMGDMGKLLEDQFLSMLSYLAEQERKKIKQRQKEGIAIAKQKGVRFGRPRIDLETLNRQQREILEKNFEKWKKNEITAVDLMTKMNLKKNTFYKVIKQFEEKIENE